MQKRITVNRPSDELYAFWRNFENLPRILDYLDTVEMKGDRIYWKATAPANMRLEWESEIVDDKANEHIAWESVEGAKVKNSGSVHFSPAVGEWGTEVTLDVNIDPPGGALGDTVIKLLGVAPDVIANKSLYKFKALLESGEIPTTKNQPAARNGGRDE